MATEQQSHNGVMKMVEQRLCKSCRRNMKKEFPGLYHCKCGMSWMVNKGYFVRTPDMEFVCEEVSFQGMIAYMPRMTTAQDREKIKVPAPLPQDERNTLPISSAGPFERKPEDIVYGGIYYIKGHHRTGDEIYNSRPAVVVSDVSKNGEYNIVTVAYLTKQYKKGYDTRTVLKSTGRYSTFLAEQTETVDVSRLGDYYGKASPSEMTEIKKCLAAHFGLRRYIETSELDSDTSRLIAQQAAQIKALEAQLEEQTILAKKSLRKLKKYEPQEESEK